MREYSSAANSLYGINHQMNAEEIMNNALQNTFPQITKTVYIDGEKKLLLIQNQHSLQPARCRIFRTNLLTG